MMRWIVIFALPLAVEAAQTGDVERGRSLAAQACAACHGIDGNSALTANPILAGQHFDYLYKQLRNFKSGERASAVMTAMVVNLTENDMHDLSLFYASQKPKGAAAIDTAAVSQGQHLFRGGIADKGVAACSGCHSPNGAGIPAQFPRLAGQHAEYTASQLRAFRAGQRQNDANSMMRLISSRLSDQEITALSEYLSALR